MTRANRGRVARKNGNCCASQRYMEQTGSEPHCLQLQRAQPNNCSHATRYEEQPIVRNRKAENLGRIRAKFENADVYLYIRYLRKGQRRSRRTRRRRRRRRRR